MKKEDIMDSKMKKVALNIAEKTIGFDILSCVSNENEEMEDKLITITHSEKCEDEYIPYELKTDERETVMEVLKMNDERLDKKEVYKLKNGDENEVYIRTGAISWRTLSGREWCVNLKDKTWHYTRFS